MDSLILIALIFIAIIFIVNKRKKYKSHRHEDMENQYEEQNNIVYKGVIPQAENISQTNFYNDFLIHTSIKKHGNKRIGEVNKCYFEDKLKK